MFWSPKSSPLPRYVKLNKIYGNKRTGKRKWPMSQLQQHQSQRNLYKTL
jgi:hypothetical protein